MNLLTTCLVLSMSTMAWASLGDRSMIYAECVNWCHRVYCANQRNFRYETQLPWYMRILGWSCTEDCQHSCMWKTVETFRAKGLSVPQFFGKWPFARWFGLQEPASAIFSLLNGVSVIYGIKRFRQNVPSTAPMYYMWHVNALIALNAWFWSTVFHSRDNDFTEVMDYAGALFLVSFNFLCCLFRVFYHKFVLRTAFLIGLLVFDIYHVYGMVFVHFDYGYNMKVNVLMGLASSFIWLSWCRYHQDKQPYTWKCALTVLFTGLLLSLELGDFPPILWIFDAHSIWHAGTSPLALLFYSFCIDDCRYLLKMSLGLLPPNNDTLSYQRKDLQT